MSIKQKAISGLFWTFSQQFGVQFVNFAVSIVLARILLPSDFGLIGMLSIFISLGTSLMDSGLTSSLIRTEKPDQRDYSTVFLTNLLGSIVIYAILFISAPYIAAFYNQKVLESIVHVYTLTFIINAFVSVRRTKLTKEMNFKMQMTIQIPSIIGGGIMGIVLASFGYGVWSLVYMNLFQSLLATVQLWVRSGWKPSLQFDMERFKYHFNFGYKLTLSGILDTVYNNLYYLIIGRYFSATQLGFYTRAKTIRRLPVQNISTALNKVTYPLFSSIQHNDGKLKMAYKKLMQQVLFWIAPTLIIAAVLGEPLFRWLLTEKWVPAVPYFQILCVGGIMYPLHSYNLNILKVKGRSDLFLRLEIIKKTITTVMIVITIQYGIFGLLWGQVVTSLVAFFINTHYSGKLINYGVGEQLKDIMPILSLATLAGAACLVLSNELIDLNAGDLTQIIIAGGTAFMSYLVIAYLLKFSSVLDFRQLVLKR